MDQPCGLFGRLRGDWPFSAGKISVFMADNAGISAFGFLFSVLGQTMSIAVFADAFTGDGTE